MGSRNQNPPASLPQRPPRRHVMERPATYPITAGPSNRMNATPWEPPGKRRRGRPRGSGKQQLDALGTGEIGLTGFTPHKFFVNAGEDIEAKIVAFSQEGRRGVFVLSANGAVSRVTLHAKSGAPIYYEGRFEIMSLSASTLFEEGENGGLTVFLAGSDCKVLGGRVAGMLIAASPVQMILGSFEPAAASQEPSSQSSDEDGSQSSDEDGSQSSDEDGSQSSDEDESQSSDEDWSQSSDEDGSSPDDNQNQQPLRNMQMYHPHMSGTQAC